MTLVRLEPVALRSQVKHYTTEPLHSLRDSDSQTLVLPVTLNFGLISECLASF